MNDRVILVVTSKYAILSFCFNIVVVNYNYTAQYDLPYYYLGIPTIYLHYYSARKQIRNTATLNSGNKLSNGGGLGGGVFVPFFLTSS